MQIPNIAITTSKVIIQRFLTVLFWGAVPDDVTVGVVLY
jgi:hypothetical protein